MLSKFTGQKVARLSADEARDLARLETEVTEGLRHFRKAGLALKAIRDRQLYRATHETFEAFVLDRWGLSKSHAYRVMDAAEIAENLKLSPMGDVGERTLRPLAGLDAENQAEAWAEATAASDGRPTAAAVEAAATKRKPKRKRAKPKKVRFRVPGATVVIEPNKRFDGDQAGALRAALAKIEGEQRRAA